MPTSTSRLTPAPEWRSRARSAEQTKVLGEILEEVARAVLAAKDGPMPVATFDLDSTLFDNRPRQLAILTEFAREHGLGGTEALTSEQVDGWKVAEMIGGLGGAKGREDELRAAFRPFWKQRFFTSEFCRHDLPLPGAAEYVRAVEGSGTQVVYLTGRHEDMRRGTTESLKEGGFPAGALLMKPTFEMTDTQWKEVAVGKLRSMGPVVACFDNEPAHVNRLKSAFPEARVVWLLTDHSPDTEAVHDGAASIQGFLR